MMKLTYSYFGGYHICLIFLQVIASTSENLMVTAPTEHLVARVGGQAELSCQVTPPRSLEYMEVRWFRSGHSQPVYLYRGSRGVDGEAAPEYENRIELVKDAIGKGKLALRIHNISIADDGPYWCSFNDSAFSYVASVNLSVAAFGLKMRIHVQSSGYGGFIVGCFSEGWFPQPRMEWRDSKGEVVPYSSISHSQDAHRFFHVNMTLLRNQSQENITCCAINPLTGEEKQTNLILSNALFNENDMKTLISIFISISIFLFLSYILITFFIKPEYACGCKRYFRKLNIMAMVLQFLWFIGFSVTIIFKYVQLRSKVSISDPQFSLYNNWMADMVMVVGFLVPILTATTVILSWTHIIKNRKNI